MAHITSKKISAIILAGGQGSRFHGKKQFAKIGGKNLWEYPYDAAASILGQDHVTVVGLDIPGGPTRTESVINGVNAIPEDTDRIVILEAARPLVTTNEIDILIQDKNPSSTFVRPLVNTVVFRSGIYLNRNELYELLTPQAFDFKLLKEALNSGKFHDMTDETRIMFEYFGILPHFIETTASLFKVTYPEDIYIAENIMKNNLMAEK